MGKGTGLTPVDQDMLRKRRYVKEILYQFVLRAFDCRCGFMPSGPFA